MGRIATCLRLVGHVGKTLLSNGGLIWIMEAAPGSGMVGVRLAGTILTPRTSVTWSVWSPGAQLSATCLLWLDHVKDHMMSGTLMLEPGSAGK